MGNPREMGHSGDPIDFVRQILPDESKRYFKDLDDVDEVSKEERQAILAYAEMRLRFKFSINGSQRKSESEVCRVARDCLLAAHESVALMTTQICNDLGESAPGKDLIFEAIVGAVTSRHCRDSKLQEKEVFCAVCDEVISLATKLHELEKIVIPNGLIHEGLLSFAERRKKTFHTEDLFSVAYMRVRSKLLAGEFHIRSERETIEYFKGAIKNAARDMWKKHYGPNDSDGSNSKPNPKQATSLENDHGSTEAIDFAEQELLQRFHDGVLQLILGDENKHRKDCLLMRLFLELSRPVIAERLGIPLNTVKSHIQRGLKRLRDLLEPPSSPETNE